MIPFGKWAPDVFELNARVAAEASGVLPGPNAKTPWPSLEPFSMYGLPSACRGGFLARTTAGTFVPFAGTADGLFKFGGTTAAWTDVSGGTYSVPDDERWSFAQFGRWLFATNANDDLQVIDVDGLDPFSTASGSPPRARYISVFGDFLFLGCLTDAPDTIRWSAVNNPFVWDPHAGGNADLQQFPDGGFVTGLSNLETGLIFQENAIRRITPAFDTGWTFTFSRLEDQRGCIAPDSLVVMGRLAFYLSQDGWFVTDGSGASRAIGADVVDKWFQQDANMGRLYAVCGAADPIRQRVFWIYPKNANVSSEILDGALCYDLTLDEWTHAPPDEIATSFIFTAATPGVTLEDLDAVSSSLDALPFSLDSRFLLGGAPALGAFDSSAKLAFFSGAPMAATVETAEFSLDPNFRAYIRGVRPIGDTESGVIQIGSRERLHAVRSWSPASSMNISGVCPTRASGRYHRVRLSTPAGEAWTALQGVEVDAQLVGGR